MGFIGCVQGQAEGIRGRPILVPISEGIPQDVLESFGVQENQEGQVLCLIPEVEQSTLLYSGEMREFLPSSLGDLVLRGEELVRPPGSELGIWVCDPLEDWSL